MFWNGLDAPIRDFDLKHENYDWSKQKRLFGPISQMENKIKPLKGFWGILWGCLGINLDQGFYTNAIPLYHLKPFALPEKLRECEIYDLLN